MIELTEIKAQLRLEPDYDFEDDYLILLRKAAQAYITRYLNRPVRWEGRSTGDATEIPLFEDIKIAALMLIAHFYENRESTAAVNMREVPLSTSMLLDQYRIQQSGYIQ